MHNTYIADVYTLTLYVNSRDFICIVYYTDKLKDEMNILHNKTKG